MSMLSAHAERNLSSRRGQTHLYYGVKTQVLDMTFQQSVPIVELYMETCLSEFIAEKIMSVTSKAVRNEKNGLCIEWNRVATPCR